MAAVGTAQPVRADAPDNVGAGIPQEPAPSQAQHPRQITGGLPFVASRAGLSVDIGVGLFGVGQPAAVGQPGGVTSLSGTSLTPLDLALRLLAAIGYIVFAMVGVGVIALFLSTLTDSGLGAALGTLAILITSEVLTTLDAAAVIKPYLPTNYWLSWIDFFRSPIFWHNIERGLIVQACYLVVFLGAAWANMSSKDITS